MYLSFYFYVAITISVDLFIHSYDLINLQIYISYTWFVQFYPRICKVQVLQLSFSQWLDFLRWDSVRS